MEKSDVSVDERTRLEKENAYLKRTLRALQIDCDYLRISYAQAEQMRDKTARERERQLTYNSFFLENHPSFIAIFDTELRFVFGSPSVRATLGIPQDISLAKEPFRFLFLNSPLAESWIADMEKTLRQVMVTRVPYRCDETLPATDGTPLMVQTLVIPVINREQECIGVSLVQHDTTEITRAKLKAEEASRIKAEFLANMSHEIRTPLNAIIGMAYLTLKMDLLPQAHGYITKVSGAANSLLGIVNDILDFSKIEAGKFSITPEPFFLDQFLADTHALFALRCREKGLSLNFFTDPDVPNALVGDTLRLTQVCNNILSNALKFTEKGSIHLSCQVVASTKKTITLAFTIADTGVGMKPEFMEHLFKPFTQEDGSITRKYGGTGLGLAITRLLVEMMEGEIIVESTPDTGTSIRFTCVLGIGQGRGHATVSTTAHHGPPHAQYSFAGQRVLLAEDNPVNQEIALELLTAVGLDITIANNGQEALEQVLGPQGLPFDLILMDLQMPVMDGFEAARRIRAHTGITTPIIAMTAHVLSEERQRCRDAGMNDHIAKPIVVDTLYATIARHLHQSTHPLREKAP